jgi:hypothetical protein
MNSYIFTQRKEDLQQLINLKNNFNNISQIELIKKFNREAKIGFTGVHQQALLILALNQQFIKRYNDAPVIIENNSILSLKRTIKQIENSIIIYNK